MNMARVNICSELFCCLTVNLFFMYRMRRKVSWLTLRTRAVHPPSSVVLPSRSWSYGRVPFPTITEMYGNTLWEEQRERERERK